MAPGRRLSTALVAFGLGLGACGGPTATSDGTSVDAAHEVDASTSDDRSSLSAPEPPEAIASGDRETMLQELIGDEFAWQHADLRALDGAAGPVPGPETHFPIEGPRKGALFPVGEGRGYYEFSHNEHWGVSALYLYDAQMRPRSFDEPPVLNVRCDGESFTLEPGRESFEEEVADGGWHFEDDALLGYPDSGRFRFVIDGRTYTPAFAHIHVGSGHAHATEHATGPHLHGLGPHRGYIVTLGAHRAHLEVVHEPHWGILGLYLFDAAMEARAMDAPPILNIVSEDGPHQLTAGQTSWDGEEDGGWHFEDDVLLGETGPGRFRLVVDGTTWTPPFTYSRHGEEPGHAHPADAEEAAGH